MMKSMKRGRWTQKLKGVSARVRGVFLERGWRSRAPPEINWCDPKRHKSHDPVTLIRPTYQIKPHIYDVTQQAFPPRTLLLLLSILNTLEWDSRELKTLCSPNSDYVISIRVYNVRFTRSNNNLLVQSRRKLKSLLSAVKELHKQEDNGG